MAFVKGEIKSILKYGFASKWRGICVSPFYSPSARNVLAGKMTRLQLIQKLRQRIGDHVLFTTITSYRKKLDASKSLPSNNNNNFSLRKLTPNNCSNLVAPQLGTSRKFALSSLKTLHWVAVYGDPGEPAAAVGGEMFELMRSKSAI